MVIPTPLTPLTLPTSPPPHLPISQPPHLPISPSPHLPISPSPPHQNTSIDNIPNKLIHSLGRVIKLAVLIG
ncbi:hypothetical protein H6G66_25715 [Fischerella sp. FACHB-380]|nr:hypothetical protein [Fischerella sp. FACHB-380]